MEQRKVDDRIARQQDRRRHSAARDRREVIQHWAMLAVVDGIVMAVMFIFGGG